MTATLSRADTTQRPPCSCGCGLPARRRGLSSNCYNRAWRHRELDKHPVTKRRSPAETVALWLQLRDNGATLTEAAPQLGLTPHSLRSAIRKHETQSGLRVGTKAPDSKLPTREEMADWYRRGCPL